jgi:hypothetical protein
VVLGVVAGVLLVVEVAEDELPELPPQPAIARVLASAVASVSIAVSGVLFMGRAPNLARWLGDSPYQPFVARI